MSRPEPDAEGKIPCIVCDHLGHRNRGGDKRCKYLCNYCHGTKMRVAPAGYRSAKQLEADARVEKLEAEACEERRWDAFVEERDAMTLQERVEDIEEILYNAKLME